MRAASAPTRSPLPSGEGAGGPARRDWRLWALLGLLGLLLGLHLAAPRLDSDQAVTGLMGVHVLRGEFPIFFWGQNHAGVPESYGAAVTFYLLGVSRFALSLVPALAALGLALALYRTGALLFGRGPGLLAILFATVVSPYVFAHYVRARAYYVEHLLVGQIVLLGAALWLTRPLSEAARARALVAMGLAGGLGLYFGFQIVDALAPAALALLLVDPRLPLRRGAWLGLGAFLLGSAPFWLYNLAHDWATVEVGVRFQGDQPGAEAARALFLSLLPVVLGVQDYVDTPPYLPSPFFLVVPIVVGGALALLALRVARGWRRLRRDPALAGEALLLVAALVTAGMVWYGRFLAVPRYLVPLIPPLALVLARAGQLVWRRARAVAILATAAYLVTVAIPLVQDVIVLWPGSRAAYWAERRQDEALFAFLERRGLTHVYSYEYWVAPRLTFDAAERIVVAEAYGGKQPAYTELVDASPRPAYLMRGVEQFENWLRMLHSRSQRAEVSDFTVFWDFTPPPAVAPAPRAGFRLRTSPGKGEAAELADNQLESGWTSAAGPPGSAWVEVDLGQTRAVSGLTLLTDQPQHVPQQLVVEATDGAGRSQTVARVDTGGFTPAWRNGSLRVVPTRATTLRFPATEARRLRLTEAGPAGAWAVSELFVLGPAEASPRVPEAIEAGRRLEAAGMPGQALLRYHAAMRAAPDDPRGHAEFLRLAGDLGLLNGWPAERAARYLRLGLADEARLLYERAAARLDPGLVYPELNEVRARLARAAGDTAAADRLRGEAAAARTAAGRLGANFGRVVELAGVEATPPRARPGDTLALTYRWRLLQAPRGLAAWVHFLGPGTTGRRFGDDHGVPEWIRGLTDGPQDVTERRQIRVPPDAPPGTYRVVAGVWKPTSKERLRRWAGGLVPTWGDEVEVGTVEIVSR